MVGLIDELGLDRVVVAGYDIGSRIAQTVARTVPDRVHALALASPLPGSGDRVLTPDAQRDFWYQRFHRLGESFSAVSVTPLPGAGHFVRAEVPGLVG
jgi:pimeloyl-ACP methyl ester carboxylesterase